eukprot:352593_1
MKDELLNNPFEKVSIDNYANQFDSASALLQCSDLKRLSCSHIPFYSEPQASDTGIDESSPITVPHILALLFYCNFTVLCTTFSSTFRRIRKDETDDEIKGRNSHFFNLSKLLFEAIHLFGTALNEKKFGTVRFGTALFDTVYHGINLIMVFENMNQRLNGPFSTTSQFQVALQFASNAGLVLTLNRSSQVKHNKYFDCACISDYSGESEKLFLGGRLQIKDILHVPSKQVFGWYCTAFTVLTSMLNMEPVNSRIVKKTHAKFYLSMMDNDKIIKFPQYIQSVWKYTTEQIKSVEIDLQLLVADKVDIEKESGWDGFTQRMMERILETNESDKYGYKLLNSFLMLENGWINLQRLCNLLPNLEQVKICRLKRTEKKNKFIDGFKLNEELIDNILQYQPVTELVMLLYKPDECDMSIQSFVAKCRESQKGKIKKQFVVETGTETTTGTEIIWICFNGTPLHQACTTGEYELVSKLLANDDEDIKQSINKPAKVSNATPLMIACDHGHLKCVECLLSNEFVDVNILDQYKNNVLMMSVAHCHNEIAIMLLEHSDKMEEKGIEHGVLDINQCDNSGESILHKLATNNNHEIMEALVKRNINPNLQDSNADTALMIACEKKFSDIIEMLLKCGADPNIANISGITPLVACIGDKYNAGVELLIQFGADVNKINQHEKENRLATALYYATRKKNKGAVALLLNAGADPTVISSNGQTLLHIAIDQSQLEILKLIYESISNKMNEDELYALVNYRDNDGKTALCTACYDDGMKSYVEFLMDTAKCDINVVDNEGKCALYTAIDNYTTEIAKMLINSGSNVDVFDKKGQSLLFIASDRGKEELLKSIYNLYLQNTNKSKATEFVNHRDNNGITALFMACEESNIDCVKFLVSVGAKIIIFDNNERSVLHYAATGYQCVEILKFIYNQLDLYDWTVNKKQLKQFVNHSDNNHETALFASYGSKESAEYLITIGGELDPKCNVNAFVGKKKNKAAPLAEAAYAQCLELVNILIDAGAKIDSFDHLNKTALHRAAGQHQIEIVKVLYNRYLESTDLKAATKFVNHKSTYKTTALFAAFGSIECVEFLLSVGAQVNIFNDEGESLLLRAAYYQDSKSLKAIYNQCVKNYDVKYATKLVNTISNEKETALSHAAINGNFECVEFLLSVGATVNRLKHEGGNSILHRAAEGKCVKTMKAIYNRYLESSDEKEAIQFVNNQNEKGETALLIAAQQYDSTIIIQFLHSVGADFNICDGMKGRTLLHYVDGLSEWRVKKNEVEPTQIIYELYLNDTNEEQATQFVNVQDFAKETALHVACEDDEDSNVNKIKYLLWHTKCDANIKNNKNETALMIAAKKGYTKIVKLLLNFDVDVFDVDGNCEALCLAKKKKKECAEVIEEYLMDKLPFDKANEIIQKYPEEYNSDDDAGCLVM